MKGRGGFSPSASVRTARSGSFGVTCRPADIRMRHSYPSVVANLPWRGFGKICGDERDIDDGKYGMDEGPHPEAVWTQTVRIMIMNELTKSEKRKCRELIQLGLNRECAKFVHYHHPYC